MSQSAVPPRPDPAGPASVAHAGDEAGSWEHHPWPPEGPPPPSTDGLPTQKIGAFRRFFQRRPRVIDLIVMAAFAIPGLLSVAFIAILGAASGDPSFSDDPDLTEAVNDFSGITPPLVLLLLLAIVTTTVALWWRRSHPTVVLTIATTFAVLSSLSPLGSGGFEWAMAFAVYAIATTRNPRTGLTWMLGSTAVVVATMSVATLAMDAAPLISIFPDRPPSAGLAITVSAASSTIQVIPILVALAMGSSVYNRRQYVRSLEERTKQLQLERDQREQLAVVGERVRIARELHDVTAHSLTVMVTLAEGASRIAEKDPTRAAGVMQEIAEAGRTALTDTRRVVGGLRAEDIGYDPSAPPSEAGSDGETGVALAPAPTAGVESLIASFRSAGLPVTLTQSGPPLPEIAGLRLAVYRIVQEALTNVLRYAASTPRIEVSIAVGQSSADVSVTNDAGASIAPAAVTGSGRGLIGMRERVAVLGGTLQAGPTDGGWRVSAHLPIPERNDST